MAQEIRFPSWQEIKDTIISFLPPAWVANLPGKVLNRLITAIALGIQGGYAMQSRMLRLAILATSEGEWLRAIASGFGMATYSGVRAQVVVRFRRYSAGDPVTIPFGTQVSTVDNVRFATTTEGILPAGEPYYVDLPCECALPGTVGNIAAGEIVGLVVSVPGVDEVTNPNPVPEATQGIDSESDPNVKSRVPLYLASLHRATIPATEYAILYNRNLFPEVVSFTTQRNLGVPGYFRAILCDTSGGDLFRPSTWVTAGNAYWTPASFVDVYGAVLAGFPCRRFGVVGRSPDGEETYQMSPSIAHVGEGEFRWFHDRNQGRLYLRADSRHPSTLDITIYAGVVWRALRELELNWIAIGVQCDVLAPFPVKHDVRISYRRDPGYQSWSVEQQLRNVVSGYVAGLSAGQPFLLAELYDRLNDVAGASGVLVDSPVSNVVVPDDSVFRLNSAPEITQRS